ncbi:hypothetical protein [Paenibacillus cymbidii]|uniref:hypothetical protein n=1 Tax=Paenibacillus cymbidii TaxID=1639034 RepID=UPI001081D592|nr:hypothetical protein [Paenibacillus cymbidii]
MQRRIVGLLPTGSGSRIARSDAAFFALVRVQPRSAGGLLPRAVLYAAGGESLHAFLHLKVAGLAGCELLNVKMQVKLRVRPKNRTFRLRYMHKYI